MRATWLQVGVAVVWAVAEVLGEETAPVLSAVATVYVYVVFAARPVSVKLVPVGVPTATPLR